MNQLLLLAFVLLFKLIIANDYVPQWIIQVKQKDFIETKQELILNDEYKLINKGKVGGDLDDIYTLQYTAGINGIQYTEITQLLNEHPQVIYVEQEYNQGHVLRSFDLPNDPYWKYQWPWYDTETRNADINIVPVWAAGVTGKGTTVLVVDNGIQLDHPDLQDNIDRSLCYSVIYENSDINPIRSLTNPDYPYGHGTACAGEIAMIHDNRICGTGVAYHTTVAGFQLDFENILQSNEVSAFGHQSQVIQVSSNSWGPPDNGYTVKGPGTLSKRALINGVTRGRNGLGTIYVFSSGNGGDNDDSCAADGYASSIYTIAIGSVDQNGDPPNYEEKCSAKLAVAYAHSSDISNQVVSTYAGSECVRNFTGTSAAAPLVSGVILLALEVNPKLSWRDVQYLIVYTSNSKHLDGFITNGAGLKYAENNDYGFGVIDAEALVTRAYYWTPVGPATVTTQAVIDQSRDVTKNNPLSLPFTITLNSNGTLEHVVMTTTFNIIIDGTECYGPSNTTEHEGPKRGDTAIKLCSPSKTCSLLLPKRALDYVNCEGYTNWPFMSVAFWGEDPNGDWELSVEFDNEAGGIQLTAADITLYTLNSQPEDIIDKCDPLCATPTGCSYGNGSQYCDTCKSGYYRNVTTLKCVTNCWPGSCIIENTCVFYNGTCPRLPSSFHFSKTDIIITSIAGGICAVLVTITVILCGYCLCCKKRKIKGGDKEVPLLE